MRVLILSPEAHSAGLAHRLAKEGHHVDFWVEDKEYKNTLKGYVEHPESWRPVMAHADLVVCDTPGYSKYAELFAKLGKPMLGLNPVVDVLETDLTRGFAALNKLGIKTPELFLFSNVKEAQGLDWTNPAGYVIRMQSDYSDMYVCETRELYEWALSVIPPQSKIMVTAHYPKDACAHVMVGGWFNGIDWIEPFNYTFGSRHGCIVSPVSKDAKLVKATTSRLAPILSRAGYRGPIALKCILMEDDVHVVDIKCTLGKMSFEALMTGMTEPVGACLFDVATGIKKHIVMAKNVSGYDFLGAVPVSHNHEYEKGEPIESGVGMPICGLTEQDMKFAYFHDMQKGESCPKHNGDYEHVMTATSFGRSTKEVQHRINKLCKNIKAIGIHYPDDVSKDADKNINQLKEWGWL